MYAYIDIKTMSRFDVYEKTMSHFDVYDAYYLYIN